MRGRKGQRGQPGTMPFGASNAACSSKACLGQYSNDVSLCHYVHLQRHTFAFSTPLPVVGSQSVCQKKWSFLSSLARGKDSVTASYSFFPS